MCCCLTALRVRCLYATLHRTTDRDCTRRGLSNSPSFYSVAATHLFLLRASRPSCHPPTQITHLTSELERLTAAARALPGATVDGELSNNGGSDMTALAVEDAERKLRQARGHYESARAEADAAEKRLATAAEAREAQVARKEGEGEGRGENSWDGLNNILVLLGSARAQERRFDAEINSLRERIWAVEKEIACQAVCGGPCLVILLRQQCPLLGICVGRQTKRRVTQVTRLAFFTCIPGYGEPAAIHAFAAFAAAACRRQPANRARPARALSRSFSSPADG